MREDYAQRSPRPCQPRMPPWELMSGEESAVALQGLRAGVPAQVGACMRVGVRGLRCDVCACTMGGIVATGRAVGLAAARCQEHRQGDRTPGVHHHPPPHSRLLTHNVHDPLVPLLRGVGHNAKLPRPLHAPNANLHHEPVFYPGQGFRAKLATS